MARPPTFVGEVCLFCDTTELTREHLWPDWVVQLFPTNSSYTAKASFDGTPYTWHAQSITNRPYIVCESCNTGWMSRIEDATKPILRPLIINPLVPRTLTVEDHLTIAAWTMLRSVVFDSQSSKDRRYYSRAETLSFKEHPYLAPPAGTHIWLASYRDREPRALYSAIRVVFRSKLRGAQILTFVMNNLAIQFVAFKGRPDVEREGVDLNAYTHRWWREFALQVWPSPQRDLDWPLGKHLTPESLDAFRHRFGRGEE